MRGRETSRCEHNEFYVLMVADGIGEAEPIRPWKHRRTAGVSPDPIIELWPWSQARHLPLSDASLLALDLWKDKFRIGLDLMLGVFHEYQPCANARLSDVCTAPCLCMQLLTFSFHFLAEQSLWLPFYLHGETSRRMSLMCHHTRLA